MYVVTSPCVGVKDMACVPACPVDCIYQQKSLADPDVLVNQNWNQSIPVSADLTAQEKDLVPKMVFIKEDDCID